MIRSLLRGITGKIYVLFVIFGLVLFMLIVEGVIR